MAIPNTTPTPNELFNGEMAKMSDTELRVVLVVVRATLGWEEDKETKMRKQEDWISYYQLKQKTGRSYTALAKAIENCIRNGWIEIRDKNGNLLETKNKRIGNKLFYRLGKVFLNKIEQPAKHQTPKEKTSQKSEDVAAPSTSQESVITESVITESEAYKINTIQKKPLTKEATETVAPNLNCLINLFKEVNPSYKRLFSNKTERKALQRLINEHGEETIRSYILALPKIIVMPYAPKITTPYQLEKKLGELIIFMKQEKNKLNKNQIFSSL